MLFNSLEFAVFLPIIFFLYWSIGTQQIRWQNLLILGASYFFYGWWDWRFLFLLVLSSLVDFQVGKALGKRTDQRERKYLLWTSLGVNLGILVFFKYYNFFIEQFVDAFGGLGFQLHYNTLKIILPVGISFYTFQTLSYTIDIYRKQLKPVDDWLVFFTYVSFFPQLVAGPIERAKHLLPQFVAPRIFKYAQARDGLQQILWGLFKKMLIADSCAPIVDNIFYNYESLGATTLILGAVLFAFQIYGDFSGYSDIAIGTSRLFGFDLRKNFAYPYFSRDIAEFWRRWHISLSTWFRDYLYIPLGGSKVNSQSKLLRNIFIIFIVSGFWHGANWTFIAWGALHAFFYIPIVLLGQNRTHLNVVGHQQTLPSLKEFIQMLFTFSLVCMGWIFFRAENIHHALGYFHQMLTTYSIDVHFIKKYTPLFLSILILILIEWNRRHLEHGLQLKESDFPRWVRLGIYLMIAMVILLFAPDEKTNFLYFQF